MPCLSSLPDEVLKVIMALIPFIDRLTSCCLVSRRLHAAAVAATECLELINLSRQRLDSLPGWLSHYGQHLTRLHLGCPGFTLQQLPCPMLLELQMNLASRVQLHATDGCPGALQQCTKLTRLELNCIIAHNPPGNLVDGLSSLVHLQHLQMRPKFAPRPLSSATLPRLQCLTHLDVNAFSAENLLQLGGLTSLQELTVLPVWGVQSVGPSGVPGLEFPTSLRKLILSCHVEAALLSLIPTGLDELQVKYSVDGLVEGPDSFLSGLARLQSLTRLLLEPEILAWPPAGPAYAALTASSNLVSLEVVGVNCPDGIWPYIFPANHKLPQLTKFVWSPEPGLEGEDDEDAFSPSWGAAHLAGLVSCCPRLCEVQTLHVHPGMHISRLHKLTALTSLCLSYVCEDLDDFSDSVRGMAVLSQLRKLDVTQVCENFRVSSLLPLTSLTALVSLKVEWSPGAGAGDDDDDYLCCTTYQESCAPDVWLQLLLRCATESECKQEVLRAIAHELTEHKSLTLQQQQQLSAQQQQLLAQEQLVAAQQRQITGLQEQLSAQQLAASVQMAGLRGQLQGLHEAVQQLLSHHR